MGSTLRLMTHNVWNCDHNFPAWDEKNEDCSAPVRVRGLLRVYQELFPDVIGCQEVSPLMADCLREGCVEEKLPYTMIWGRYTPILYRTDTLELIDASFGTYPETIDGFEGSFNDVKSKSWSLAVFRRKDNGRCFIFATTHLWWMSADPKKRFSDATVYQAHSDDAREYQIALLAEQVKTFRKVYACPAVLVGDLNDDYRSKAVAHLHACGFRHAHDIAVEYAEQNIGYHACFPWGHENSYSDKPFEEAIDHIFLYGEEEGSVRRFERYSPDYYFTVSDHSPAYIDIEI